MYDAKNWLSSPLKNAIETNTLYFLLGWYLVFPIDRIGPLGSQDQVLVPKYFNKCIVFSYGLRKMKFYF